MQSHSHSTQKPTTKNITVTQLDDEPMDDDMKLNLSESAPSEFRSMSSMMSRSPSSGRAAAKYCQERSPHSISSQGSQGMSHLSVNRTLRLDRNGSPCGPAANAYCTPEGRNEVVCDSARNQPKFAQYGVQAPRKGASYICDSDSCSSARKQRRPAARNPMTMSNRKVKEFRLDASDVDSSSDSGSEQTQVAQSSFGSMANTINMVQIGSMLTSSTPLRI